MAAAAARLGFRRLFSVSAFAPPPPAAARPAAEPCTNLFVSGLNKRTTSETLREAFAKFGQIVDARVITDRASGYSRGFGFVRYASIEEAESGIKGMDGKKLSMRVSYDSFDAYGLKESFLDGWVIFAEYARPRDVSQPPQASAASVPAYQ